MERHSDPSDSAPGLPPAKRAAFIAVAVLFGVAVMEVASAVVLQIAPRVTGLDARRTEDIFAEQSEWLATLTDSSWSGREVLDDRLGWRYRAGFSDDADRITEQGLRGSRVYEPEPEPGVLRVAAFGDSFVYGTEVGPEESWPALLEARAPRLEVLNYGVGGYGTDQSYLRFLEEGLELEPDLVLIGFAPVNLRRAVNRYRRFISSREYPFFKPRFRLDDGGRLELVPSVLADSMGPEDVIRRPRRALAAGVRDHWYRPAVYENPLYDRSYTVRLLSLLGSTAWMRYLDPDRILVDGRFNPSSEAFRVQLRLLETFHLDACRKGAPGAVLLLPDRDSVRDVREGRSPIYAPLLDSLEARGVPVLDGADAFVVEPPPRGVDGWFARGGHYSPAGNAALAAWLDGLLGNGPPPDRCQG